LLGRADSGGANEMKQQRGWADEPDGNRGWADGRIGGNCNTPSSYAVSAHPPIRPSVVLQTGALALMLLCSSCKHPDNGANTTANAQPDASVAAVGKVSTPAFDANASYELIKRQVAFGPRVPGTAPHEKQLQWMVQYLKPLADTVIVQPFTHKTKDGKTIQLANVFARFKPAAHDRILLLAHWDTRPTSDQEQDSALKKKPIPGA